ncbi:MAG: nucleotidyl transferase AbiEii/AbiGii toxin family protein [Formivibrio sp.]|nr:nucleotidyl transferase AbiEii/AbiGii toxin family protein [Formivibrio sp.]
MSSDLGDFPDTTPENLPSGVWIGLLQYAFRLVDDIHRNGIKDPFWTFGGGTVLMLRYRHRMSKDIDIFVPDPQYLGFVSPRLSDIAEEISNEYVEGNGFVKLIRPEGEIDFVASPNLTSSPFEVWTLLGRKVRVETPAEIVAKKLWHRGDRVSARDLFDLSLVIEHEPQALMSVSRHLVRYRTAFLEQLQSRSAILKLQFEAIDALAYRPTYEDTAKRAAEFLGDL